jgi:hypothetical protein
MYQWLIYKITLSYVIQHFYRPLSENRVTYRRYYNWLYRNTTFIMTLMEYTAFSNNLYIYTSNTNLRVIGPDMWNLLFKGGLKKLFSKLILRWRPIRESQHVRGVEYWAYKVALTGLGGETSRFSNYSSKVALVYSRTHFYNQCFFEHRYVIFPLYKKYYRLVMLEFLHLLLRGWQFWRVELGYSLNLIFVATDFYFLPFFNSRFFKTLTV